jgi:hypothetical protein
MGTQGLPPPRPNRKERDVQTTDGENGRLADLEGHATRTEGRLGVIERTQLDQGRVQIEHGDKLDRIMTAVTRYDARPIFNIHEWVRTAGVVIGLSLTAGGIFSSLAVWLVLTLTAANDRVQEVELRYTKERLTETRDLLRELAQVTFKGKSSGN